MLCAADLDELFTEGNDADDYDSEEPVIEEGAAEDIKTCVRECNLASFLMPVHVVNGNTQALPMPYVHDDDDYFFDVRTFCGTHDHKKSWLGFDTVSLQLLIVGCSCTFVCMCFGMCVATRIMRLCSIIYMHNAMMPIDVKMHPTRLFFHLRY